MLKVFRNVNLVVMAMLFFVTNDHAYAEEPTAAVIRISQSLGGESVYMSVYSVRKVNSIVGEVSSQVSQLSSQVSQFTTTSENAVTVMNKLAMRLTDFENQTNKQNLRAMIRQLIREELANQ